jgi:hypothetical protein
MWRQGKVGDDDFAKALPTAIESIREVGYFWGGTTPVFYLFMNR